jgi:hypothetical protein
VEDEYRWLLAGTETSLGCRVRRFPAEIIPVVISDQL